MTEVDADDEAVRELADDIARLVRGGDTIAGAIRRLAKFGVPEPVQRAARIHYERQVGLIRELRDPFSLVSNELAKGYWYDGPKANDTFWPAVKVRLSLDNDSLNEVDRSSTKVVGLLRPPGADVIATRGLVLGYVQSGKTTSFTSVIAKAADVGYRLFIVLSGITDNLRTQTQERLQETLVGDQHARWHLLTDLEADFHQRGNAANLLSLTDQRLLAVVKKNPYRLKRLLNWLDSAGKDAVRGCPIMLVDDEADQASIDVGSAARRSRINGLIKQILDQPRAAYVAYTATPFANLLIDVEDEKDLYPRDFIVDLKPGGTYFGPERIFGREPLDSDEEGDPGLDGLDIVRAIEPTDVGEVQPPNGKGAVDVWEPSAPESLAESVRWFVLATAARVVRDVGTWHSSMLIHTSMLARAQEKLADVVRGVLTELRKSVERQDTVLLAELRKQWDAEAEAIPPDSLGEVPVAWDAVVGNLPLVLATARVIVDNYRSDERLLYSKAEPTYVIAVGGNTLSRGLTLEGLVCSYFVRAASAYDTLLQMGRWFGYRHGYGDLMRIWMTSDLARWFFDLSTVEEEVRRDIRKYDISGEAMTPLQAAIRIRTHPAMRITSAAKMRHAVTAEISYGATRQQTILFNHTDATWLTDNLEAGRRLLVGAAASAAVEATTNRDGRPLYRGVSTHLVLEFLRSYHFHPAALSVTSDLLAGYVEREFAAGFLNRWNIVVMEHSDDSNGTVPLGMGREARLIERARLDMPGIAHANIKALVSTIDRAADIDLPRIEIEKDVEVVSDANLLKLREHVIGDVGLLCLYPISKDSRPRKTKSKPGSRQRLPMKAVEHLLGVAAFLPDSRGNSSVTYMSADLSSQIQEDFEGELQELDHADEQAGADEDREAEEAQAIPPTVGGGLDDF
ncbi:Z1 domain-containing protein [Nakamurella lactea]|uniref:Z1 domain-containing protein n=1 Tax=Nakamurella lactea TaxID=459515 RepID=UPI0003F92C60|nr:Z1 domain-containing protein [Nakamurella lactea]